MMRYFEGRQDSQVGIREGSGSKGHIDCLINKSIVAIVSLDGDSGRNGGGSWSADHFQEHWEHSASRNVSNIHDIDGGARCQLAPNSSSIVSWGSCGDLTVSWAECEHIIDVDVGVSTAWGGEERVDGSPGDAVVVVSIGIESCDGLVGMKVVGWLDYWFGVNSDYEAGFFVGVSALVGPDIEGEATAVRRSGDLREFQVCTGP